MSYPHAKYARDHLSKPINSGFKVGAVVLGRNNAFAAGNIEHENSGLNICAERLAIMNARMNGVMPEAIHLVSDGEAPTFPCGVCRQYMAAFPKLKVTVWSSNGTVSVTKTASQLLPNPFVRKGKNDT